MTFQDGLNVIFGGSNAGKSFVLKAIDFIFGADSLKLPDEGNSYETMCVWITLPGNRDVTLVRSVKSGEIIKFDGHLDDPLKAGYPTVTFAATNKGKRKGKSKKLTISDFIFEEVGLPSAQVVKNETGEKTQLSLRMISRYLLIGESAMLSEGSPVKSPELRMVTEDKSIFRFLITGTDDKDVTKVTSADELKASRSGKLELLQDLISELNEQIGETEKLVLQNTLGKIDEELSNWDSSTKSVQKKLDDLRLNRRKLLNELQLIESQKSDQVAMSLRFNELKSVYLRDIERLEAVEEAAFLLGTYVGGPCAVCGAESIHQHRNEDTLALANRMKAAETEIGKIHVDIGGLTESISSLEIDINASRASIADQIKDIDLVDADIAELIPIERNNREKYENLISERNSITAQLTLFAHREDYQLRIEQLNQEKIGRQRAQGLPSPVGPATASDFSDEVRDVLKAWNFPSIVKVDFDEKKQDIVVDGKNRADNGKGIRAILHSAFKVALLLFCQKNNLPHPGILVLDSPLLTYRSPLTRHGDLTEDEKYFGTTAVNIGFYDHLNSLNGTAQIIILENQDPPNQFLSHKGVQAWGGKNGAGRQGFFPS